MQDAFSEYMQELTALDKQVLVERHLISPRAGREERGQRRRHQPQADPLAS